MTHQPVFECDATGARFGAKNDVLEFGIRRHGQSPFEYSEQEAHVSNDRLAELDGMVPSGLEYVGVKDGEIVGVSMIPGTQRKVPEWIERDDVRVDHYEQFFQFVEEEVLL